MPRIFSYFTPWLVLSAAKQLQETKYDPDKFLQTFLKTDPSANRLTWYELKTKAKMMAVWGYYFWLFYCLAAVVVLTYSLLGGIFGLLISPFIAVGSMYAVVYALWEVNRPKRSKAAKQAAAPKKSKKKPAASSKR